MPACRVDLVERQRRRDVDRLALDRAVAEHGDDRGCGRRERHQLDRAHRDGLGPRPDDHRGIVRERRQQIGGAVQHLLEPAVRGREELPDRRARVAVDARRHEVVDEEAVALVGRDAPGRRVRLDEVALLLEHGHLVAHRRGRDAHAGRVGDVGGPDGKRRGDVLLHHRTQDRRLAFVEHGPTQDIQADRALALIPRER